MLLLICILSPFAIWSFSLLVFLIFANVFWGRVLLVTRWGLFLRKKGGIQVLAGLAPSRQTVGSLLRTSLKIAESYVNVKRIGFFNTKMVLANFTICRLSPNSFVQESYYDSIFVNRASTALWVGLCYTGKVTLLFVSKKNIRPLWKSFQEKSCSLFDLFVSGKGRTFYNIWTPGHWSMSWLQ